ncbi:hypothetical protein [Bacteroides stercoris]|uniref:hypothetical protein n=1 Tax=Bacteroides stercoris TaxID=46506 RepID=UPI00319DFD0D
MGAIKTMKEVESALPQKKEINYIRALDKDGNPILINKEDLAQVVGELIPIATLNNNGLWDKKMTPRLVNYKSRFMVVKNVCVVNLLVSTRHAYATDNILAVVQVIYGMADDIFSVRYHYLLPKKHEAVFINLKYKKTEDKYLNLYIDSNDPVISILSVSDISCVELLDEPISEFPQDAIDAVEV